MEENRTIESFVAQAVQVALHCKSIKFPDGEYISEHFYRKIMRDIESRYVKKESKEIPDYIKGKLIELPKDLQKKYDIVAIIWRMNEMTYREEQQLLKAIEILNSLYYGNHETHTTHTTDPDDCDRTETKYPTGTTTCTG